MSLFHVSCNEYQIGQVISVEAFEVTEYYQNAVQANNNWIDDFLDEERPENVPPRQRTIFTFDSIENCAAFQNSCVEETFYYKVEMLNPTACPMCLTDALELVNTDLNNRIREEYWNKTLDWKYLEYLDIQMTIIEKLAKPNFISRSKGMMDYLHDKNIIKNL